MFGARVENVLRTVQARHTGLPDGDNYIAFLTDRTGAWEVWINQATPGNPRPLFDTELDGLTLEYAFAGERAIDWT